MEAGREVKEMICVVCPRGCRLRAAKTGDGYTVSGNKCKRGVDYAIAEMTAPVRTVTTTVAVEGGEMRLLPVRSDRAVPKGMVTEIVRTLGKTRAKAPVKAGDIICRDVCGCGADIIACCDCG